jgi:hypothetical protein
MPHQYQSVALKSSPLATERFSKYLLIHNVAQAQMAAVTAGAGAAFFMAVPEAAQAAQEAFMMAEVGHQILGSTDG